MKKYFLPLLILTLSAGFSSCKKCAECDCSFGDHNFCMDEYDSKDQYNAAIANLEVSGCTCKEKLK
ncbi:MAG: hypothetical protein GC178_17290 [Flavobacteriales bacterium]|nr:hypothetical protein [Flavobacteriales bacterium]